MASSAVIRDPARPEAPATAIFMLQLLFAIDALGPKALDEIPLVSDSN
ncbi:hypothetical protein BRADO5047 [Bradyrhizobium sp. ORS 278]|nr:hypothetical protein BRADO5047 [Bradyrhizobium sp. ORS 278]